MIKLFGFVVIGALLSLLTSASADQIRSLRQWNRRRTGVGHHRGRNKRPKRDESSDSEEESADTAAPFEVPGLVVAKSRFKFDETCANLEAAINSSPANIAALVDHAAGAASVNLDLAPNKVFIFGNPAAGTPLMQLNRAVGLDLPQKMLVWQDDDNTNVYVGYNNVNYLEARHPGIDAAPSFNAVAGLLRNLAAAATGVDASDMRVRHSVPLRRGTGVVTVLSDTDFETSWNRLVAAIEASPANVFLVVEHSANAPADNPLLPTRLAVLGNPNLGTPLMQVSPTAGIDLPLKILVWQDDDNNVFVTTNDIDFVEFRHDIDGVDMALNNIANAISNFVSSATTAG